MVLKIKSKVGFHPISFFFSFKESNPNFFGLHGCYDLLLWICSLHFVVEAIKPTCVLKSLEGLHYADNWYFKLTLLQNGTTEEVKNIVRTLNEAQVPGNDLVGES